MRITGGEMRGRKLRVPRVAVRPTQDRVREALFSSLQTLIPNSRFLDLFAGSGAVGLEALSRGAAAVCWVDKNSAVFKILRANIDLVCGQDAKTSQFRYIKTDVFRYISKQVSIPEFDIIFADPPYEKTGGKMTIPSPSELLTAVLKSGLLAENGIMILEQGSNEQPPDADGWALIREKRYGGSQLRFYRMA